MGIEPSFLITDYAPKLSVCESGRNCQDCAQISVLDFIGSTKIS